MCGLMAVLRKYKKVLMSNYSASKLLGADDDGVTDKTLIAFSRNEVLNDCVDKALSGESKNGDTTVKGRALQIITNPVYSNGEKNGAICLIIDVSAKKKAEKMRREFTANVTHELKTPLTSISGYAEIIASGLVKPDDIPNFANKIHKESGRLLSLISDIMELSQLDEKFSDEEFAPVDLAGVAAEVLPCLYVLIHQQLHLIFSIIGKAHNGGGAGRAVQILLHVLGRCEAQAGDAQLVGKLFGLEGLVAGYHEQIEARLLPVAQEQIFADCGVQAGVDDVAVLHGIGLHPAVVGAPELDAQLVQQVVGADLFFQPPGAVGGTALV